MRMSEVLSSGAASFNWSTVWDGSIFNCLILNCAILDGDIDLLSLSKYEGFDLGFLGTGLSLIIMLLWEI